MGDSLPGKNDRRSVAELVTFLLSNKNVDDLTRDAICALHWRGTKEVLEVAGKLCQSDCMHSRWVGSAVLGQLGVPERTYPEECVTLLFQMLGNEKDPDVIESIFIALSFHHDARTIPFAMKFSQHPDADVRVAVAMALNRAESDDAISTLIRLSNAADDEVRDWATFGLGSQTEFDSAEVREALAARLSDSDPETRGEALVGLARRADARAVKIIKANDRAFIDLYHFEDARDLLIENGLL